MILDVNGVGYVVNCSSRTLAASAARGRAGGARDRDAGARGRDPALRLSQASPSATGSGCLQSVQGVGAKVALALLSTLSVDDLASAVAGQDKATIARAPGVGPKLAARIVAELKDKAPDLGGVAPPSPAPAEETPIAAPRRSRRDLGALQSRLWPPAGAGGGQCEPRRAGPRGRRLGADPPWLERARAIKSTKALPTPSHHL